VQKGKHLSKLPQKYQVTPYDIYQLNPDTIGFETKYFVDCKTTTSKYYRTAILKPNSEKSTKEILY
jgi:hypothetical protein